MTGHLGGPICLLLLVAGCAYDPPMAADHAAPKYKTDLAACQDSAGKEASRRVKARFPLFVTYPISFPVEKRIETRKCMEGKGYKLG
ncbi:MAG: hypothetical protein JOY71_15590 [Acetobacteraceae bacterium]|nr:hypothetical protein [Acetobacteraceae bacterium]MBV8523522.1 hypothetical protein [Acetobacteraceae bacterium]MBV8589673.1 hypothetical protein [Acetobacteraceae bacterium]